MLSVERKGSCLALGLAFLVSWVSKVRFELFTKGNERNKSPLAYISSVLVELLRCCLRVAEGGVGGGILSA